MDLYPHQHEMVDHPATPGNDGRRHVLADDCPAAPGDTREPCLCQYDCLACHAGAHAQYAQDVAECTDGSIMRDGPHPVIYPDGTDQHGKPIHHGPCAFLAQWHEHNGYCPLHT